MKLNKLGENLYVPENFERFHHYYADAEGKKEYTGITSIIGVLAKPALIGWAAKCAVEYVKEVGEYHENPIDTGDEVTDGSYYLVYSGQLEEAKTAHTRKKEAAGVHGTDVHALVEAYIKAMIRGDAVIGADISIKPFVDWSIENVDHFLFAERRMYDPELFIAGTADFAYIGKDGKKYMGDFKTSSGIYGIDYWLQTAAYRMLAEKSGDEAYDGCMVARLGKDGKFEVQYVYDYETCKSAFLACVTLYRAQAAIKDVLIRE